MRRPLLFVLAAVTATGTMLPALAQAAEPERERVPVAISISPGTDHQRYGIGQLVTLRFSEVVKDRKAAEDAITVSSDKPLTRGAWGWIDDTTAIYRPRKFWPGNADIRFDIDLAGVVLARTDNQEFVGNDKSDRTFVLRTDRSFVLEIKDSKHRLYVRRDGRVVKSFPVSLGKAGWRTRSGIKILTGEKYARLRMTGYDPGADERWDVIAPYSIRLTPTGEFIHGAPWANNRMGLWNGSHGCTNMFVADAKWLFKRVVAGDPVVTKGTGRPMEVTNGTPGSYWNYSWKQWQKMSGTYGGTAVRAASLPPATIDAGP